jgi:hypothetical protein
MAHDETEDKQTRGSGRRSKSYDLDGNTAEFDAGATQMHEFSPEFRRQISGTKLPRLDPKVLEDAIPQDANVPVAERAPGSALEAPTQPAMAAKHARVRPADVAARHLRTRRQAIVLGSAGGIVLCVLVAVMLSQGEQESATPSEPQRSETIVEARRASAPATEAAPRTQHAADPNAIVQPDEPRSGVSSSTAVRHVAPARSAVRAAETPSLPTRMTSSASRGAERARTIETPSKAVADAASLPQPDAPEAMPAPPLSLPEENAVTRPSQERDLSQPFIPKSNRTRSQ